MAASASSQFGLVLLFSIGTLLLLLTMAPQFGTALECYYQNLDRSNGEIPAAWEFNNLTNLAKISRAFGVAANDNTQTIKCPAYYPYCVALHCEEAYGDKMLNYCAPLPGNLKTPAEACEFFRWLCGDDPKFYCHYCQTDKCNNEGVIEPNANATSHMHNMPFILFFYPFILFGIPAMFSCVFFNKIKFA